MHARPELDDGIAQSSAIVRASALDDVARDPPNTFLEALHDPRTPQGLESSYMSCDNFLRMCCPQRGANTPNYWDLQQSPSAGISRPYEVGTVAHHQVG